MTRLSLLALAAALAACVDPAPPDTAAGGADAFAVADAPPADVLDAGALARWLPADVGGLVRSAVADSADAALGAEVTRASAAYGAGPEVTVAVSDLGSADMAEMMGYGWGLDGPAPGAVGGHPAQAEGGVAGRPYRHRVLVARRFLVEAESAREALAEAAVRAVDLDGLAGAGR